MTMLVDTLKTDVIYYRLKLHLNFYSLISGCDLSNVLKESITGINISFWYSRC